MIVIALPLLLIASGTEDLAERVERRIERWDRADSPGGALAILQDGALLVRVFGAAQLEPARPVTESTPFYLASLAKPFTAACAVHAAQAGELDLKASVRTLFPELPEAYQAATLLDCMHHRSGIADVFDVALAADLGNEVLRSNADAIALLTRLPRLDFAPGSRFRYCNSGYVLLAEALRRSTGRELDDYAREHLFGPSGMADSYYLGGTSAHEPARAYRPSDRGWEPIELATGLAGPGGLRASLADLIAFAEKPLDPLLLRAPAGPHHPRIGPYAAGWMLVGMGGHEARRHFGGAFGFSSDLIHFPARGLTVIALSNCAELDASELGPDLARLALGEDWIEEPRPTAAALGPAALARFGRFWIDPATQQVWALVARGAELSVVALGDLRLTLVPVSETRLVAIETQAPFALELQGGQLVVESAGQRTLLEALPFPPADLAPLSDYTGPWRSADLDARIVLEERRGRLAMRQERPLLELPPFHAIARDLFLCERGVVLRFERDEEGAVAGLTLDVNRASGLAFQRTP